ncbi:MAG: glycine betaine ABC transporter substrate-binding protein [Ignavibacteria bacterium]
MKKCLLLILFLTTLTVSQTIRVGAKHFNESYILAEIISQLLESNGYKVERNFNLGGTLVCFESLKNNQIDVYPEYTGTISEAILKLNERPGIFALNEMLKKEHGLEISGSFGFNNTYAFAVKKKTAEKYQLVNISDLKPYPEIKAAMSYEFIKRKDGWENLAALYHLKIQPIGIDHGLAYQSIDDEKIELTDVYSTDGEINKYQLVTLNDDKNFFPSYMGVPLMRQAIDTKAKDLIRLLAGTINDSMMREMNSKVLYENKSFGDVANEFLKTNKLIGIETKYENKSAADEILEKTLRHLQITFISLILAILIAFPLGVLLSAFPAFSKPILYVTGLLQTIPSIALLAVMIPVFGIGIVPAVAALFLYALLPILRNTTIGIYSVDPVIKKVASGMGLTTWQKLRYVEIPLAMPSIFAGIKTAAVINIGTATLAAFIGAGGLGEFIVTGLALNDTSLILKGAIPAAILAILVEFIFEILEQIFIPKHLNQKTS